MKLGCQPCDARRVRRPESRRLKIRVLAVCKTLASVVLLRFAIYIHPKTTPWTRSGSSVLEGLATKTISLIHAQRRENDQKLTQIQLIGVARRHRTPRHFTRHGELLPRLLQAVLALHDDGVLLPEDAPRHDAQLVERRFRLEKI